MRTIIVLAMLFVTSCTMYKPDFHSKMIEPVYIDYTDYWLNKGIKDNPNSITIRVINKRYTKVTVVLVCEKDNIVVGKKSEQVEPRNDKYIRVPLGYVYGEVNCFISKTK